MKVHIWKDEAYPVYGIDEDCNWDLVEIPDGLYIRYLQARKEYLSVQEELSVYYKREE